MSIPHDPAHADLTRNDPELGESLGRGHEQRDTLIKPIVVFMIVLVLSIVVVQFAVLGMQKLMEHQEEERGQSGGPAQVSSVAQNSISVGLKNHVAPPEPRLQPSPFHPSTDHEDWNDLKARWDVQLSTVGKFEGTDRVHIPVDRVIDMAVEKGIGSVKPAATQPK